MAAAVSDCMQATACRAASRPAVGGCLLSCGVSQARVTRGEGRE